MYSCLNIKELLAQKRRKVLNIIWNITEKEKSVNEITLEDSEENTLSDDALVSVELNNSFWKCNKNSKFNKNSYIVDSSCSITDPVDKATNTYKSHSSILLIKQKLENLDHFSLKEISIGGIAKELSELNSNKAITFGNIPSKLLKQNSKACSDTLQKLFNDVLRDGYFPDRQNVLI